MYMDSKPHPQFHIWTIFTCMGSISHLQFHIWTQCQPHIYIHELSDTHMSIYIINSTPIFTYTDFVSIISICGLNATPTQSYTHEFINEFTATTTFQFMDSLSQPHFHIRPKWQTYNSIYELTVNASPIHPYMHSMSHSHVCIRPQWHTSFLLSAFRKCSLRLPVFSRLSFFFSLLVLDSLFVLIIDISAVCVFVFEFWTSFYCQVCSYWTSDSLLSTHIGSSLLNSAVFPIFPCISCVTFITFSAFSSNSSEIHKLFLEFVFFWVISIFILHFPIEQLFLL